VWSPASCNPIWTVASCVFTSQLRSHLDSCELRFVFMLGEMDRSNLTPVWRKIQCMLYFKGMNPYCLYQPTAIPFGQLRAACTSQLRSLLDSCELRVFYVLCDLSTFTVHIRSRGCDKIAPSAPILFLDQRTQIQFSAHRACSAACAHRAGSAACLVTTCHKP